MVFITQPQHIKGKNIANKSQPNNHIQNNFSYVFFLNIYFYLFGCIESQLWHVGSSSLTRDQTQPPCIRSAESQPLDHQGIPFLCFLIGLLYPLKGLYIYQGFYISRFFMLFDDQDIISNHAYQYQAHKCIWLTNYQQRSLN